MPNFRRLALFTLTFVVGCASPHVTVPAPAWMPTISEALADSSCAAFVSTVRDLMEKHYSSDGLSPAVRGRMTTYLLEAIDPLKIRLEENDRAQLGRAVATTNFTDVKATCAAFDVLSAIWFKTGQEFVRDIKGSKKRSDSGAPLPHWNGYARSAAELAERRAIYWSRSNGLLESLGLRPMPVGNGEIIAPTRKTFFNTWLHGLLKGLDGISDVATIGRNCLPLAFTKGEDDLFRLDMIGRDVDKDMTLPPIGSRLVAVADGENAATMHAQPSFGSELLACGPPLSTRTYFFITPGAKKATAFPLSFPLSPSTSSPGRSTASRGSANDEGPKISVETRGEVLVIRVPAFYENVWHDVALKLQYTTPRPAAVVLDLADNPGGFVKEAVEMAGLFLGDVTVLFAQKRGQPQERLHPEESSLTYDGPVVIHVNAHTGSAAETFAAAMQDYRRAVIVGTGPTMGMGLEKLIWFHPGGSPYIGVVAATYRPSGAALHGAGVRPDRVIPPAIAEIRADLTTTLKFPARIDVPKPTATNAPNCRADRMPAAADSFETAVALAAGCR